MTAHRSVQDALQASVVLPTVRDPNPREVPRLMPPTTEHRALCPSCQRLAVREVATRSGSICEATFTCEQGHAWLIKWLAAA